MKQVLIFVAGAAVGSLVTWKLVEKYYKNLADEEIESVVQRFKPKTELANDISEPVEEIKPVKPVQEYKEIISDQGYSQETLDRYSVYIEPGQDEIPPYMIMPEDYGERDDFDTKTWIYYSDYVLTDEEGEIVSEPENIIGDALAHFEDDCVYVRNHNTECDYEILKQDQTFSEVYGSVMDE